MAGQTSVIISYNAVDGHSNGWHGDKKLFIHANDDGKWGSDTGRGNNKEERAQSVMGSINHQFYGKFEVPISNVNHFYIYAGINAMRSALNMALNIKEMAKNLQRKSQEANDEDKVPENGLPLITVVACKCDWSEKERILKNSGIELIKCDCGGQSYLGRLAGKILAE